MVDSRVEVMPASAWADYVTIVGGSQDALATLERIVATAVVVDPMTQLALDVVLRRPEEGWRLVYEDNDGLLFHVELTARGLEPIRT